MPKRHVEDVARKIAELPRKGFENLGYKTM
jgi:hypothetical protein